MPLPTVLSFAVAAVCAVAAVFLGVQRGMPGGAPLVGLLLALVVWSVGYGCEIAASGLDQKVLWVKVQYAGIVVVPLTVLGFLLQYAGRGAWLRWRRVVVVSTIPVATLVLAWSGQLHDLVWSAAPGPVRGGRPLALDHGPAFYVDVVFTYCVLLLAAPLVAGRWPLRRSLRRQAIALALALAAPWLGNVLYVVGVKPAGLDLTPIGFAVTAVAFVLAGRRGVLHIAPVARHALVEHLQDGMVVIDERGRIVDCNPAVAPLLRCPVDDAVGRDATVALAVPVDELRSGRAVEIAADDGSRYYDVQAVDLPPSVAATGRLFLFRDVTTREELHALLRAEALTDDLTDLANRRSFLATLERELARADHCVGVLFLDIDGFKGVNDRHGHHAGDEILVATARRLATCVRAGDVVGRLGGDEFAVLLPDVDGTEVPLAIADRVTSALREPIDVDGRRLTVTVSVGLHVASTAGATPESLLRAADRRMYLAKQAA